MRKILVILIIIFLIYFAADYVLNFILPEKIKSAAVKFADENLGSRIEISKVKINIIRGVFLNDVSLYDKSGKNAYLKIKKARVVPFYPAILSQKKIILAIGIDGASLQLQRNEDGALLPFDKTTLSEQSVSRTPKKDTNSAQSAKIPVAATKPSLFIVKSISAKKVSFAFEDKTTNFKKIFSDISLSADFSLISEIKFTLSWQDKVSLIGKYALKNNTLQAELLLKNIELKEFSPYFKNYEVKNGSIAKGQLAIEGKDSYLIKGPIEINNASLLCPIKSLNPDTVAEKLEPKNVNITAAIQLNISKENITYNSEGTLLAAEVIGIPFLGRINTIKSRFKLDNQKLILSPFEFDLPPETMEPLNENTPSAIHINANAEIDFSQSLVHLETKTTTELARFIYAIKKIKPFSFDYKGKGEISLKGILKGDFKQNNFDYYIDYQIKNAQFKDITNVSASGFLKKDKLVLEQGSFDYKDTPIKITGELENFSSPALALKAESELFNLNLESKFNKDEIEIVSLAIKTLDSKILVQGNINIKNEPQVRLEGVGAIDCANIMPILEIFKIKYPILEKLAAQGILNAKFFIDGGKKIKEWQIKLAGLSEQLKIYNIDAKEIKLEMYRDKDKLIISPLVAGLASGKIELRTKIDSVAKTMVINLIANDIDLSVVRDQLKLKSKSLAGTLSLQADIVNQDLTNWNKLEGNGKVEIKEGNIWEINFLKGLGEFLFIPEFESITFEEGYSDLIFKGENIVFENIELKSYQMNLRGQGRISLKGDLDFILISEFNPKLIDASDSLKKIFTGVLGQNSLSIELTGTMQKPSYKVKPVFFSNIGKIKDILSDILNK